MLSGRPRECWLATQEVSRLEGSAGDVHGSDLADPTRIVNEHPAGASRGRAVSKEVLLKDGDGVVLGSGGDEALPDPPSRLARSYEVGPVARSMLVSVDHRDVLSEELRTLVEIAGVESLVEGGD